jgi:hypothetical protein
MFEEYATRQTYIILIILTITTLLFLYSYDFSKGNSYFQPSSELFSITNNIDGRETVEPMYVTGNLPSYKK